MVATSLCIKGGRGQGPSDGERSRRDGARLAVAVIRRKVGRANAVPGARIDGARAGVDGKVGLCVGGPWDQERKRDQFDPFHTVGAIVPHISRHRKGAAERLISPTCSLRPVSHRSRTKCSKLPHQPYDEPSHRKEDHREQASESIDLALESGGHPSSGCRGGKRVRGCALRRRGVVHQRRRWPQRSGKPRADGCMHDSEETRPLHPPSKTRRWVARFNLVARHA